MNYESFVTELLDALKYNDKNAIKLIEQNKKLIETHLEDGCSYITMDKFINELIDVIIQIYKNKFDAIKKVLKHENMATVYRNFKNSVAMIRAVKADNKYALKWLISMKVSPYVQDETGMTVLMYVVQKPIFEFDSFIKPLTYDRRYINQEDCHGRTALFYAHNNKNAIRKLIERDIDVNHQDYEGNNILIYCCKYRKLFHFKYLLTQISRYDLGFDINTTNYEGRTAGMYLAMNGYYSTLIQNVKGCNGLFRTTMTDKNSTFVNLKNFGFEMNNYNELNESVLSLALFHMYESSDPDKFDSYVRTIISLVYVGCNFNISVDQDNNTAIMIFLLANDYESFNYVCGKCHHVNFSHKNKNGESVTSLYLKNKNNKFINIVKLSTFDINYTDPVNGNNILMLSAMTRPDLITDIIKRNPDLIYEINHKGENALILACKANNYKSVDILLNYPVYTNIDSQDVKGNTALHYAVKCRNPLLIQKLIENGADKELKNFEDQSPYDLALGDKTLSESLNSHLTSEALSMMENNDSSQALEDIEEYLYPFTSNIKYNCIIFFDLAFPLFCLIYVLFLFNATSRTQESFFFP